MKVVLSVLSALVCSAMAGELLSMKGIDGSLGSARKDYYLNLNYGGDLAGNGIFYDQTLGGSGSSADSQLAQSLGNVGLNLAGNPVSLNGAMYSHGGTGRGLSGNRHFHGSRGFGGRKHSRLGSFVGNSGIVDHGFSRQRPSFSRNVPVVPPLVKNRPFVGISRNNAFLGLGTAKVGLGTAEVGLGTIRGELSFARIAANGLDLTGSYN